jgi:hypothetical protein
MYTVCQGKVYESMTWDEAYELFEDSMNEHYPTVSILGYDYEPARALRKLDPIAYREEFLAWADNENIDVDNLIGPDRLDD